jgi:PAS domain S-box-containing protein
MPGTFLERLSRRVGGSRVLALPLIRLLALLSGYVWVLLAPSSYAGWDGVDTTMLAFLAYSVAVIVALWTRPRTMLRLNAAVLLADLGFALTLVHFTGGARSTLFLALLLIAGLQSYYYGMRRGVVVALGSAAAYLLVTWPTLDHVETANMAIRLAVLVGTAIGVGVLADVEERERLQVASLSAAAREREAFIRSIVESLREGVMAVDPDGRIVAWNRALAQRYGVPASEAMGRRLLELNPSLAREAFAGPLRKLLAGEVEEFTLEGYEHQSLKRGAVMMNVKGSLLRHGGRPAGAVLLIEDITERVALERSARQAEKLAALGTLAAGLAHELNNPIGIISSRVELMLLETESEPLPAGMREDLDVLYRHAQRVTRIVQGLLSFARHSPGATGPVRLNDIVDETLLLIEKQVAKDGIVIVRKLAPDVPTVVGDANAIQQVLMNLVLNARDAMPGGGEITVATDGRDGVEARLLVSDSGPGIPPEVLPRIFDPFFTTKPSGTGLGLSISYGIVRDHGGSVDVTTRPGQGTTFAVTLPVHPREHTV